MGKAAQLKFSDTHRRLTPLIHMEALTNARHG